MDRQQTAWRLILTALAGTLLSLAGMPPAPAQVNTPLRLATPLTPPG